jgi:acyl-coenzyme A synthetase/AMP-(fatty) acid ligase/thioesterase domain-containing protein
MSAVFPEPGGADPRSADLAALDSTSIERPLIERFLSIAARYGDKVAVSDEVTCLTFDQLRRAALHLAYRICCTFPAGKPVAVLLPHNALFPLAALACLAAGRPYVPLDCSYPPAHNAGLLKRADVGGLVAARGSEVPANSIPQLDLESSLGVSDELLPPAHPRTDLALILFTSGSTGEPKAICNEERAILQRVVQATLSCDLTSDDRFILLSSPCTIAGVRETFSALLNGATLNVADPHRLGISGILRVLRDEAITVGYTVPALLRPLLSAAGASEATHRLRILRVGGDIPLASDLALIRSAAPRASPLIAFSSTEVPTIFQWFVPPAWSADDLRLPIGRPQPGFEFTLVDTGGRCVAAGEPGELVVRSRYLARGYWQDGALVPGPFTEDERDRSIRCFHSGDLIRLRADGLAEMLGRTDFQVKVRGLRANPADCEAALRSCVGVADAAVIARRQGEAGALVAFVVPTGSIDGRGLISQINRTLSKLLPPHLRPARIRLIETVPRLPGFKADARRLEELDREGLEREVDAAEELADPMPRLDRVERVIAEAWTTVLTRASYVANMAWEDAGGDSLSALQLWFLIEEALGPLPLEIFQLDMSPSKLQAAINGELARRKVHDQGGSRASARAERSIKQPPLVFFMPPFDGDLHLLARFRSSFGSRLRFSVIRYPGVTEMIKSKAAFDILIDAAEAHVVDRLDGDPIRLAGYSSGGIVAWETARRLQQRGLRLELLAMIDTLQRHFPKGRADPRWWRFLKSVQAAPKEAHLLMLQSTIRTLIRASCFETLHMINRRASLLPSKAALALRWHLTEQLRIEALSGWKPKPLDVPTFLFRSADAWIEMPDYGWSELCPSIRVIPVGGSHFSVLEPPHLESLSRQFIEALEESEKLEGRDDDMLVTAVAAQKDFSQSTRSSSSTG